MLLKRFYEEYETGQWVSIYDDIVHLTISESVQIYLYT